MAKDSTRRSSASPRRLVLADGTYDAIYAARIGTAPTGS